MANPLAARNKVSERFWGEIGSLEFDSLWKIGGDTLRVSIRRHLDDHRSHAVVDIYDTVGRRWNKLAFLPYEQMRSMMVRPRRRTRTIQDEGFFREDERALLELAALILDWERKESTVDWGKTRPTPGFRYPDEIPREARHTLRT
jgi:hypothetical protein